MKQDRSGVATITLAIGSALSIWISVSAAHAGTVTIGVTPSVAEGVEAAAQVFEAAYPDDRVRLVVAQPERMKGDLKRWPIQLLVSDDESLISWMEARRLVGLNRFGPIVHMPLAVIAGAEPVNGVDSLRTLSDRMRDSSTRIAILDPQKTDCGRRAKWLLQAMQLGDDWKERLVIVKNSKEVVSFVQKGKADLGVLFARDAMTAEGIAVHAVSTPDWNASVYLFAVKRGQEDHPAAQRFLAFVKTPEAQRALNQRGYELIQKPHVVDPKSTIPQKMSTQASGAGLQ